MGETEVLVVGGGPTGLLLGIVLARHGVQVRVVERRAEPLATSRALAVHARSLELLDDLGLADQALAQGRRIHGGNLYAGGRRIARVGFDDLDSPYPFMLCLPQYDTEQLLADAATRAGVAIDRGVELAGITQAPGSVTARLRSADGSERDCRVSWLVGCDGAHSDVRRAIDAPYRGADLDGRFALADVRVTWALPDDELHTFFAASGMALAIPLPEPDRWRVLTTLDEEDDDGDPIDLPAMQRLFDERCAIEATLADPVWITDFRIRQRRIERYRDGRVFLAGDAAHCHSPVGGQGMNTGLQDAYNLGWKLGLVVRDVGRSELLDSYGTERAPIAEALLRGTERATRAATLRGAVSQSVRNQIARFLTSFEVVQERLARTIGELDLHYRDSPIVGEDRGSVLTAPVLHSADSEAASVGDWRDFRAAPRPGDRALDAEVVTAAGERRRLYQLLHGPHHALLLFDGRAVTDAGYANLTSIALSIRKRYASYVQPWVVVLGDAVPSTLGWDGDVILDADGELHHRYGASAECAYLLRPDGYVGYRGQPANLAAIEAYLQRLFV